jgi:hypothetical protein
MICKVLMNYSEKTRAGLNYSYFEIEELNLLQMLLSELLGIKYYIEKLKNFLIMFDYFYFDK